MTPIEAIKELYRMDYGPDYSRVLLDALRIYRKGGLPLLERMLSLEEYKGDNCASTLRQMLGIRRARDTEIFSFCSPRRPSGPEWTGVHSWRIKKWAGFTPYIMPTQTKE